MEIDKSGVRVLTDFCFEILRRLGVPGAFEDIISSFIANAFELKIGSRSSEPDAETETEFEKARISKNREDFIKNFIKEYGEKSFFCC